MWLMYMIARQQYRVSWGLAVGTNNRPAGAHKLLQSGKSPWCVQPEKSFCPFEKFFPPSGISKLTLYLTWIPCRKGEILAELLPNFVSQPACFSSEFMHVGICFCFGAASCTFAAFVVLEFIKYRKYSVCP